MEGNTVKRPGVTNLVVDSAGFLKNVPLQDLGENIYTEEGVVKEIKDKATLERLQVLPYELQFKCPSAEDIKFVTEFAKKTGDYCSLSAVDMRVIALTYHLEKEFTDGQNIRNAPFGTRMSYNNKAQLPLGFYIEKKKKHSKIEEEEEKEESLSEEVEKEESLSEEVEKEESLSEEVEKEESLSEEVEKEESLSEEVEKEESLSEEVENLKLEDDEEDANYNLSSYGLSKWSLDILCPQYRENEDDDGDDDDDGWVTVNNIKNAKEKDITTDAINPEEQIVVACLTTDYAIQNVLLQMGLKVLSVDGMLIRKANMYLLRCFACFKTTKDMTKKFCPHCGNMTLRKTSYSVNEDGTTTYYMSKKPPNKKGLKYSLPMPKGGKYSNNPILVEDQRMPQQRVSRKARATLDPLDMDYIAGDAPFAMRDINSRAVMHGFNVRRVGQGGMRNPNANRKKSSKKK